MTQEKWTPISGFEGRYLISDRGRVRGTKGILALSRRKDGYLHANLYRDGKQLSRLVHRLVLEAFTGPAPSEVHHGCHFDGDKSNNRLSNLRWATPSENNADKRRHGTHRFGDDHASAKLSEADVRKIRARVGEPQADLASEFGCTFSNISAIQRRKSWKHV